MLTNAKYCLELHQNIKLQGVGEMNKKMVAGCVIFLIGGFLFASGYVGANIGASFENTSMTTSIGGSSYATETSGTTLGFGISGANFFGNDFGVGYSLSLGKVLSATQDGTTVDVSDYPLAFGFGISGQYRHSLSALFEIEAGIGFSASFQSTDSSGLTASLSVYSLGIGTRIFYTVSEKAAVYAGVTVGIPVFSKVTISSGSSSYSLDVSVSGVTFGPSLGVVYKY